VPTTSPRWLFAALLALPCCAAPVCGQTSSSPSSLREHVRLKGTFDMVWSLSFSRDSRTLAAGLEDKTVRVWDVVEGKELAVLRDHKEPVQAVAFSPDGKLLASGSKDSTVKLWAWDGKEGTLAATLEGHKDWVLSLAFAPGGKLLASGGKDGTVRVWDVGTRKVKFSLPLGDWPAVLPPVPRRGSSVAFSPNGRVLGAVTSEVGRLWDVATGRPLAILSIPGFPRPGSLAVIDNHGGNPKGDQSQSSAMFTPNGRYFATTWSGTKDRAPPTGGTSRRPGAGRRTARP
jgi:WD40 repeat protein